MKIELITAPLAIAVMLTAIAGTAAGSTESVSGSPCPTGDDMAVVQFGTVAIGSTTLYKHTNSGLLNGVHVFWAQPINGQLSIHAWQIESDGTCTQQCSTLPSLATDTAVFCTILGGVHGPGPWWVGVRGEPCTMVAGCIFGSSVTYVAGYVEA